MSMFDTYTTTDYIERIRLFIREPKLNFLRKFGFIPEKRESRGRVAGFKKSEALRNLEKVANERAARVEAADTTIGERFKIACGYKGFSDAHIGRELGVSRELVRRWGEGLNQPTRLEELSALLDVPKAWLEFGGVEHLPPNSHAGVRVGQENLNWREALFDMTQAVLAQIDVSQDENYIRAYLEWSVFSNSDMAEAARRCGGRWTLLNGSLLFSPWVPIEEHGLSRRYWTDEVEEIIAKSMNENPTVFAAWDALAAECHRRGIGPGQFPTRIALHKRIEKERERIERFGVDLNQLIAYAVSSMKVRPTSDRD